MSSDDSDLPGDQSVTVATRVREALARKRISRQRLADDARVSLSTLEKALSGRRPFTLATTVRLEEALGVKLRDAAPATTTPSSGLAPEALGAYSQASVRRLEQTYITLRPSFSEAGAVYAYRTVIAWDEAASCLTFHESERMDSAFTQSGQVSLPNQSGQIYLITSEAGQFRLAILARPTLAGEIYGLLTTLQAGPGAHLTPASAPLALVPASAFPDAPLGRITPDHAAHAGYQAHLNHIVAQGFARFF